MPPTRGRRPRSSAAWVAPWEGSRLVAPWAQCLQGLSLTLCSCLPCRSDQFSQVKWQSLNMRKRDEDWPRAGPIDFTGTNKEGRVPLNNSEKQKVNNRLSWPFKTPGSVRSVPSDECYTEPRPSSRVSFSCDQWMRKSHVTASGHLTSVHSALLTASCFILTFLVTN